MPPKSSPKTAQELFALVESHLARMPEDERAAFWSLIDTRGGKFDLERFSELIIEWMRDNNNKLFEMIERYKNKSDDLSFKLSKHRKPKKNAERDARIMSLEDAGKTAGEIVSDLKEQYPKLTDKQVNAAISRERRKRDKSKK